MTLGEQLRGATRRLAAVSDQPRAEAEILVGHVLGLSRARLISEDAQPITWPEHGEALLRRREQGEPLAYLTGTQGFWTFDLQVAPEVLIPRADTETLVEAVIGQLRTVDTTTAQVLDLGTGSGCIALALAREFPALQVTATDASADALEVARANASRFGLERIAFRQGDWFAALGERVSPRFNLIASNPPYIAEHDPHLAALGHEPQAALVSGADGLDALRCIASQAPAWLCVGGWLMVEHGFDQGRAVRDLFERAGFAEISTRRDLAQHERVTVGRRP